MFLKKCLEEVVGAAGAAEFLKNFSVEVEDEEGKPIIAALIYVMI